MSTPQQSRSLTRTFCLLAAAGLALLAGPVFLDALTSLRGALLAGLSFSLLFLLWLQRPRIPEKWFPWVLALACFWSVALIANAEQIRRPRNVWQFLSFADHTPWTTGHTLGAAFAAAAWVVAWKPNPSSRFMNREEILSGPRLIPMAEAQTKAAAHMKPQEGTIFWGGIHLPAHCGTEHFVIVGTPGSGKSLSLQLLMKSVLPRITPGSRRRALIYDAKRDTRPLLSSLFKEGPEPPVQILNPFDARSSPWDMSRDIREGATALQIANILIPDSPGESQPFFRNASRILLGGVMEALAYLAPDSWTLRDVILTLRRRDRTVAVLASHSETVSLIDKYVSDSKTSRDIEATLENFLRGFSFVAAAWHHSEREPVSLEHWASSEEILILGSDPKFDSILQPLNRAIFKRTVELIRRQPDVRTGDERQTWFFVDELRNAGNLEDIDKLLVEGRSKGACVVIGFQDLAGLREVFGDKRAEEITGACANKIFLLNGESSTIDYATSHFKNQEVLLTKTSRSESYGTFGTLQTSVSQEKIMRPVVHAGLLKSLSKPAVGREGLSGYCDTASVGTLFPYKMELSPAFLAEELPRPDTETPGFIPRPDKHLQLPEWTYDDLKRLGLSNFSQLLRNEQRPHSPESPAPAVERKTVVENGGGHSIFDIGPPPADHGRTET